MTKATTYTMTCQACGAKMPIYALRNGRFLSRCYGCGAVLFGPSALLERLRYAATICPHHLERKPCKGGTTTWCPLCRTRSFYYEPTTRTTTGDT